MKSISITKIIPKKELSFPRLMVRAKYQPNPKLIGEVYLVEKINDKENSFTGTLVHSTVRSNQIGERMGNWAMNGMENFTGKVELSN